MFGNRWCWYFGSFGQMFPNLLSGDLQITNCRSLKPGAWHIVSCLQKQGAWCVYMSTQYILCTHADPWVLQSLLGSDSLGWVDSQHLVDQVFSLRGHRVPLWGGKLKHIHTHACPHYSTPYNSMSDFWSDNSDRLTSYAPALICW